MDKKGLTANALAEKEAGVNVNTLASYQLPALEQSKQKCTGGRAACFAIKKSAVDSL